MVKVLFTENRVTQDAARTEFKAGAVYEMTRASANHWVSRGVATTDPAAVFEAERAARRAVEKPAKVETKTTEQTPPAGPTSTPAPTDTKGKTTPAPAPANGKPSR